MNEKGQTLIEVLIGVVLIALVFIGLFQGLSVGVWGTYLDNQLTTAQQIAQSEIDYIKSQDYDRTAPYEYDLIDLDGSNIPAQAAANYTVGVFTVSYAIDPVDSVDPELLQMITMNVTYQGGNPQQFVAFKANVDYGILGQCLVPITDDFPIPGLKGGEGHFHVVSSETEGPISAFWLIEEENRAIEIYIYMGTPFQGLTSPITEIPGEVDPDDYPLISRSPEDSQGAASTPSHYTVPPGDYTVYFYNPNPINQKVDTISATVTYMCP